MGTDWISRITRKSAWWNPVAPLPPVGGFPELHGIEIEEDDIWEDLGERVGHKVVLGTTRVGKTRLC
ncbi:conjugative coupling factor TraD, PFGI-1 class, partial [Neisseria gonorrhoeae]